jgi:hypothetical protein
MTSDGTDNEAQAYRGSKRGGKIMKRFSILFLIVLFLCAGARAHEGMIALFTDHDHDDVDNVIELYEIRDIYLYYVRGYGPEIIGGFQFRFLVSSQDVLVMNPEFPPECMAVGDVTTCMGVVGYENLCTLWGPTDAIYLGTIPVINYGEDGPFTISVVQPLLPGDPGADVRLVVLRCEQGFPQHDVLGDLYQFNGSYDGIETPTPPRLVGAETATSTTVTAVLNEPLHAATAEVPANYEVHLKGDPAQTFTVSGAALEAGGTAVVLTIAGEFIEHQDYTLRADGVTDLEGYDIRAGTWGSEIDFTAGDYVAVEMKSWGAIKSLFR